MQTLTNRFAIAVAIFVVACLAYDMRRSVYRIVLGRTVVLMSVLYWYLLEAIRIPDALEGYTPSEYRFGLFCIVLSVVVFLIAYHSSRLNIFGGLQRRLFVLDDPRILWRLMLAGMAIGFVSLLIYADFNVFAFFEGLTGMTRRWTGILARERYGSWSTILYEMQMFLQAVIPLAVCLAVMRRAPVFQRCVAGLFVLWMLVRTVFTGSRASLLPIVLCLAAAFFWRAGPRMRRGLVFIGLPVALIGAFLLSAVIVAGRNEGRFDVSAATTTDYVGFEMFRELLFVIRAHGEGLPSEYGLTYFTQLVNPIPRAIWPGKPVADAGLILARAYGAVDRNGEPTMTTSPGFLGEAYLNFGFFGLLIIPAAAGLIVRAWDRLLSTASTSLPAFLIFAAGLSTIFQSGRSVNISAFYGLFALFALLILFEQIGWSDRYHHLQHKFRSIGADFHGTVNRH
jgi:oligosaccharide repeat unit polymerase